MKIDKIYENTQVNELSVNRVGESFNVAFSFISEGNWYDVSLVGVRETYSLSDILEAERLGVHEVEASSQLEYGRFTLGIYNESYSEVEFDRFGE